MTQNHKELRDKLRKGEPMTIHQAAELLTLEHDNAAKINTMYEEFDERFEKIKQEYEDDKEAIIEHNKNMIIELKEEHALEIAGIKKENAEMKPIVEAYKTREAAVQWGKQLGDRVTYLGKIFGIIAGAIGGTLALIWAGMQIAAREAVKNADKIPPTPPPGIGH